MKTDKQVRQDAECALERNPPARAACMGAGDRIATLAGYIRLESGLLKGRDNSEASPHKLAPMPACSLLSLRSGYTNSLGENRQFVFIQT